MNLDQSGRWADVAEAYQRSFARLCAGTVDVILDSVDAAGGRMLDVGCGPGELSRRAYAHGWAVTSVDSEHDMVTLARENLHGLAIDIIQSSLPDLPFGDETFDVVVANFVINHVPDPREAMREFARVVNKGGEIVLTTWTGQRTPQAQLFDDSLAAANARRPTGQRLPDHLDFERSVDGLADLAQTAGLIPIDRREVQWDWHVRWSDLWAGIAGGVATIGQMYLAQDSATAARVEHEMQRRAEKLIRNGQIVLPSLAAFIRARRPS